MILSVVNIQGGVEECETELVDIQLPDFLAPWLHKLNALFVLCAPKCKRKSQDSAFWVWAKTFVQAPERVGCVSWSAV